MIIDGVDSKQWVIIGNEKIMIYRGQGLRPQISCNSLVVELSVAIA